MSELKTTIDAIGRAFEQFKADNDERLKTLEAGAPVDPLVLERMDKVETHLDELKSVKTAIEQIEAENARMRAGGGNGDPLADVKQKHAGAFADYLRNPQSGAAIHALQTAEQEAIAQKAVTIGTTTAGGYAVPEVIQTEIHQKLLDISPVRQVARVVTAGTSDYKELVDVRGGGYGWVGEGDTRSETGTPGLEEVAPTFGMIYAYPKASEESMQDIFFDVQGWLTREAVARFAQGEGIAFITGNGTKKPTGFLDGAPVSTGDEASPARSFGVLQYFATGTSDGFGELATSSPFNYPADVLYDTLYGLKRGYRNNATWMMNKATMGRVRKFKDADGDYLWTPGLEMGQPDRLLGYPVAEAEDMPDIGTNAFPIAFGDFREGYLIVDLAGIRATMDEVTEPGQVKWYIRKRVGGKLLNDDAIKLVKCATS